MQQEREKGGFIFQRQWRWWWGQEIIRTWVGWDMTLSDCIIIHEDKRFAFNSHVCLSLMRMRFIIQFISSTAEKRSYIRNRWPFLALTYNLAVTVIIFPSEC